jgi:D-alanyl-D-alanine dipeptidase
MNSQLSTLVGELCRTINFQRNYILIFCLFVFTSNSYAQNKQTTEYNWDARMKDLGMLDVCFWEPSIQCYLLYGTRDNFMKRPLYNSKLTKAWLHPRAARMLIRAQEMLQKERPDLSLLIYDAARPMEVQTIMSDWARKTKNGFFVADPTKGGGLHNYGMAVDVTLINTTGDWLPMGSPIDHFGPEAYSNNEDELLKRRRITADEYMNRRLLRKIMVAAGFTTVHSEWWHFNACLREEAMRKYTLINR